MTAQLMQKRVLVGIAFRQLREGSGAYADPAAGWDWRIRAASDGRKRAKERVRSQQSVRPHFLLLIACRHVPEHAPRFRCPLHQVGDVELDGTRAGLLESGTPADLREDVQGAEHRLSYRCRRESAHPVLTIER